MGLDTYSIAVGTVSLALLVAVVIDQVYQRFSHKWTNEPPLLPYKIPIVGHALMFATDPLALFKSADKHFPNRRPYSLMFFGHRLYVFTHPKDVVMVFRKAKELPFLPLIEKLSPLAWDIQPDGMRRLQEVDETGDSLFRNAHVFYRDALKPGSQLDLLSVNFLHHLQKALDEFDAKQTFDSISFSDWSKLIHGIAATNTMMGPALLRDHPNLIPDVSLVATGFLLFVNRIPRIFAKRYYEARDRVLAAFTNYFSDQTNKEGSAPFMWEREEQLRAKGMSTRDIAAYSYAAYAALLNNANPTAFRLLSHIFQNEALLPSLRDEIAPAFGAGNSITTLEQLNHLLTACPLLRAFYDETLRLHSSSPSNRTVVEETSVAGCTLKTGHNILVPAYAVHYMPEYFGPNPEIFNPDRFIKPVLAKGTPADSKMVRAFGGGISLCPGRFFASNEMLSYAAIVLWRYDIKFETGGMVRIVPRKRG